MVRAVWQVTKPYLALVVFLLMFFPASALAGQDAPTDSNQQESSLDLFSVQQYIDQLDKEVKGSVPEMN
ncbi:MAG TPA: hypothetical protein DCZ10_11785, partial [Pelotomaculum sp.]|nr:hypothetical protein [Pelotomaculum sp.]